MRRSAGSRRCPRCGGNIFMEKDYDDWQMNCIQCGYTRDLDIMSEPGQRRS
jgi:ribosomal protein S27AE